MYLKKQYIYLLGDNKMALSFENTFSDADFMPSIDEMKHYKLKLDNSFESVNTSPRKRLARYEDEYDNYGRNITEQERRQNRVPWIKVKYVNRKLFISEEKRFILRSMNLI
tara:strand:- start:5014 stop:5346 length:333 start_codon:yes stop_codon:yes gene_type:complete